MALIDKLRWSLLSSLIIVAVVACGEPAGRSAAFKQAAAPDLSPPKGGDPAGALPSHVVSSEVAVFSATPTIGSIQKNLDTTRSLPSNFTAGQSAVYAPGVRAGAASVQDAAGRDGEAVTPRLSVLPPSRSGVRTVTR